MKVKAWHFGAADKKLRYGDNRIIRKGVTHRIKWPWTDEDNRIWTGPSLCNAGLHGSRRIIDALSYAPGPIVWRVELSGVMEIGEDKIAASERKYLWGIDTTDILRVFARRCALDVVDKWDAPEVVIRYLKTGDESIRGAAWDAAGAAARGAAWDAAGAAAKGAAWGAAWAAARDAARSAAWAAALKKQNNRLTQMVIRAAA